MNKPKSNEIYNKKPYIKPQVTKVKLVAGEAVLATCKFNNGVQENCDPDLACFVTWRT